MREKFTNLLTVVEAMPDDYKCDAFRHLISAIKGTDVIKALSSRIGITFSNLLTVVESMAAGEAKGDAFSDLVRAIKGTEMMREKFSNVLDVVEIMPDGHNKLGAFSDLVYAIKGTDVMREKCANLLTAMESIPDNEYKVDMFSDLISAIEGTNLMKEKFGDLLTVVETMPDDENKLIKIEMFTKLINTIAISFKKKFTIRELLLHQYFYQCCKVYPKNIILIGNFVFFLVNSRDYFNAKLSLPLMRSHLTIKKLVIIREEKTLLRLLYNFFPDPQVHNIRVNQNGPSGKKEIIVGVSSFVERGIAIGCRGEYIKAVNKLFEENVSFGENFGFQIIIKCEDIHSRGKIS